MDGINMFSNIYQSFENFITGLFTNWVFWILSLFTTFVYVWFKTRKSKKLIRMKAAKREKHITQLVANGKYTEAIEMWNTLIAHCKQSFGANSIDTYDAILSLAALYNILEMRYPAKTILEEIKDHVMSFDKNNNTRQKFLNEYCTALVNLNLNSQVIDILQNEINSIDPNFQSILEIRLKVLLATAYQNQCNQDRSLEIINDILSRKNISNDDRTSYIYMNILKAKIAQDRLELSLATDIYRSLIDNQEVGDDIFEAEYRLSQLLIKSGHFDSANELLEIIYVKYKPGNEKETFKSIKILYAKGGALKLLGDAQANEDIVNDVISWCLDNLGKTHPFTIKTQLSLVKILSDSQRVDEVDRLLDTVIDNVRSSNEVSSNTIIEMLNSQALHLLGKRN